MNHLSVPQNAHLSEDDLDDYLLWRFGDLKEDLLNVLLPPLQHLGRKSYAVISISNIPSITMPRTLWDELFSFWARGLEPSTCIQYHEQ